MKKSFITKEYSQEAKAGTFSMLEKRNFFGGKILEIDDIMNVNQNDITWIEASDNTQGVNIDNKTQTLNTSSLKGDEHTLRIYPKQSTSEINQFTTWELVINIENIIKSWIFAQLKKFKTFSGIRNDETKSGEIDSAIKHYIELNIIPRIEFATVYLYIRYFRIGEIDNTTQVALKFDTKYTEFTIIPPPKSGETTEELLLRSEIFKESIQATNFNLNVGVFGKQATILYKQTKTSENYKFDYYFDVVYRKA